MSDINLDTGTIEYFISDDSDEAIFIGKDEGGNGIGVSFGDGGDEYKTFKNSKDAVAYAKELGNQLKRSNEGTIKLMSLLKNPL